MAELRNPSCRRFMVFTRNAPPAELRAGRIRALILGPIAACEAHGKNRHQPNPTCRCDSRHEKNPRLVCARHFWLQIVAFRSQLRRNAVRFITPALDEAPQHILIEE